MVRSTIGASVPMASAMREPGLVRCPSRWPSCALTWNETVTSSSLKLPVRVVQRHPLDLYLGLDADIEAEEDGVDVIIGEVKEGRAELNAGLRRTDTVAFAIRRLGCCPERDVSDAADRDGETHLTMAPGLPCRVRLVAFGGSVAAAHGGGVRVISLVHCIQFIERRGKAAWDLVGGLHFEDPMLGLFAFRQKLNEQP